VSKRDKDISGEHTEGAIPVSIPNTEVKSFRADDTALEMVWESRSLPDILFINSQITKSQLR
jgi:hypothetical protein